MEALTLLGSGGGADLPPQKNFILHSRPHFLRKLLNFFWNHRDSPRLRHDTTLLVCGDAQTSRSSIRFWLGILGAGPNRVNGNTALAKT